MEGDELWYDDLSDRAECWYSEDEYFDLAERAEATCEDQASFSAQVLARFVTSLKNAIATTSSDELKKRFRHVRGRLLTILAGRNEKRVDTLVREIGGYFANAEQGLAVVLQTKLSTQETNRYFDNVESCLRFAAEALRELQIRKYLQEFAKKREEEIFLLKEKLRDLRTQNQRRPQIVSAAVKRDDAAAQQLLDLALEEAEEKQFVRQGTIAAITNAMDFGDLVTARNCLAGLQPLKVDLVFDRKTRKVVRVPDDPEMGALDERLVALSITEVARLKGLVDGCVAGRDFSGAMACIGEIEELDERAITKVFGGSEQVAMLKQRCDRQVRGVRKSPHEIPRL